MNQLTFETNWLARVLSLQEALADLRWQPQATVCFVATRPKTREIHAHDFADRVVHHYLVPQLEALYDPVFIHDSYANRKNKGTHKAVARLQQFMRQQPQGYYLQLDVHNFFNSLNRQVLYRQLCKRLDKAQRQGNISAEKHHELKTLCHTLVNQQPAHTARYRGTAQEHAQELPQPQPVRNGCDFLGYIVYPTHSTVRRRVIRQCKAALRAWWQSVALSSSSSSSPLLQRRQSQIPLLTGRCVGQITLSAAARQHIRSLVGSYWGHFSHASHWRLTQALLQALPWLHGLFLFQPGKPPVARFACGAVNYFADQVAFYRQMYPGCALRIQKGYQYMAVPAGNDQAAQAIVCISECGWLRHGLKRREVSAIYPLLPTTLIGES